MLNLCKLLDFSLLILVDLCTESTSRQLFGFAVPPQFCPEPLPHSAMSTFPHPLLLEIQLAVISFRLFQLQKTLLACSFLLSRKFDS